MADLYTTQAKWQAYAEARGKPGPSDAATPEAASQALQNAEDYIRIRYVRRFTATYAADTFEGQVAADLEEATNIAAEHELESPGRFTPIVNPAEDREVIQVGDIKWRPSTHANTEARAMDSVPVDANIHALLDRYLPLETDTSASGGVSGFAALGVSLGS